MYMDGNQAVVIGGGAAGMMAAAAAAENGQIGRASCRETVYVLV